MAGLARRTLLALSPMFASDGAVYAYHSAASDNRIVKLRYSGSAITGGDVIVSGIPRSSNHNGGRIRFGPDGMLYAGTGDVEGASNDSRFVAALHTWPVADASPSGIAVTGTGVVYMAALRGQRLWRVETGTDGPVTSASAMYQGTYGWLRAVAVGPDGRLWIVTSNRFRGTPVASDDRVVILPDLA